MSIFGGTINNTEVTKASFFTTYIPIISVAGSGGTLSSTSTFGRYIQLGKLVYVQISIGFTVASGSPSIGITLPISVDPTVWAVLTGVNQLNNQMVMGSIGIGKKLIVTNTTGGGFIGGSNQLYISGWYSRQ